ncbi:MAG: right-handed parallel beta-helix repeat-containing protein [Anaerolineae bacterium]|nr:right-handed parallel beta-helix repeat-containing protein [Anaerolineae bacterium]
MTGSRIFLLVMLALVVGVTGLFLIFEPAPEEPPDEIALRMQAIMASSASLGMGILVPQMALAARVVEPQAGQAPVLVAIARKTKTPTPPPTPTVRPTDQPTLEPTATTLPTDQPTLEPIASATPDQGPTIHPTDVGPPTAVQVTFTPLPTQPPSPTGTATLTPPTPTPAVQEPQPTSLPAPLPTEKPSTDAGLAFAIGACGALTKPGGYYLTGNLGGSGDCLNLRSNNIVLDCKGFSIQGVGFNGVGIVVRKLGLLGNERPKNIEIRNCTVSGYRYGIYVEGSSGAYIHHNVLTKNFDDVDGQRFGIFLGMVEGGGIRLNDSDNGRIESNNANTQAIGIDVRTSTGIQVRKNDSSNNSAWGVNLVQTTDSEVSGNTTNGNVRYCTWGAGVVGPGCDAGGITLQDGSSGNRILNNEVGSGNGNGIFIKAHGVPCGDNNVIAGNNIHDIIYNSIELSFCTGNQIVGNRMSNSIDGIWMGFAKGNVIKDNTIANMNNHGIIVLNSLENEVTGNQITNTRNGIYFFWEQKDPGEFWWLDVNQFPSRNNRISNNTLRDNTGSGIFLQDSTDNLIHSNVFANNAKNFKMEGNTNGNELRDNQEGYLGPLYRLAQR